MRLCALVAKNKVLLFGLTTMVVLMLNQMPLASQKALEGKKEVVIGGFAPLTGPVALNGIPIYESATLAVEEWNKAGGILGLPVRLVFEDDAGDAAQAVSAVTKLLERDHVVAIIGGWMSGCTLAASEVYEKAKVPCLTLAMADKIFARGFKYVFNNSTAFMVANEAYCDWIFRNTDIRKIAYIADDAAAGRAIYGAIEAAWVKKKGGVITSAQFAPVGTKDFYPIITKALATKPDAILSSCVGTAEGLLVRQQKELNPKTRILSQSLFSNDAVISVAGDAADGAIFYTFAEADDPRTPMAKHLVQAYKARWNKRVSFEGFKAYESAQILKNAIETAKSLDPTKIRNAIAATKDFDGVGQKTTFMDNGVSTKKGYIAKVVGTKRAILADAGYLK